MDNNEEATVASAILELARAIDRQTDYLSRRDELSREDWLRARQEDNATTERRRQEDWERGIRVRAEERADTMSMSLALRAPRG